MKENRKDFTIEVECSLCHKKTKLQMNKEDYWSWEAAGVYAQDAFPYLTPEERDVLITHTCIDCQHKLYSHFEE